MDEVNRGLISNVSALYQITRRHISEKRNYNDKSRRLANYKTLRHEPFLHLHGSSQTQGAQKGRSRVEQKKKTSLFYNDLQQLTVPAASPPSGRTTGVQPLAVGHVRW